MMVGNLGTTKDTLGCRTLNSLGDPIGGFPGVSEMVEPLSPADGDGVDSISYTAPFELSSNQRVNLSCFIQQNGGAISATGIYMTAIRVETLTRQ
jgi:hypothetical protein